jgi:hypothetical protein
MRIRWLWLLAVGASIVACDPGSSSLVAPAGGSGSSSSGGPSPSSGGPITPTYAPAGIRRLGRAEVERAAAQLLGIPAAELAAALGDDTRQAGFTRNVNERLTAVQADALWTSAQKLAAAAVSQRLSTLAPCPSGVSETCAAEFIHAFLPRAFRRTIAAAEEANLLAVYRTGASGATYSEGIGLVVAAILQSPSFLYVTELGTPVDGATTTKLSGDELATSLALLLTGKPADEALLAAGRAGTLDTGEGRAAVARALLAPAGGPSADVKAQIERLVLEWVGADVVASVAKDETQFPDWYSVRADLLAESQQIVDSVIFGGDGTLATLLTTPRTFLTPALARFYGVAGSGAVTQPSYRRGLMLAGAFVAANSYPAVTAPVKRGAMVRKRLLCVELPVPTNLGTITVPVPDPTLTTRERFDAHATNPACSVCHKQLDPPGFALEIFDTAGRYRSMENGKPIQTAGELLDAGDASGAFTDGVTLMSKLARSRSVAECFPRQLYRFSSGRAGGREEDSFAAFLRARPSAADGKVLEELIDYVASEWFALRRLQ